MGEKHPLEKRSCIECHSNELYLDKKRFLNLELERQLVSRHRMRWSQEHCVFFFTY